MEQLSYNLHEIFNTSLTDGYASKTLKPIFFLPFAMYWPGPKFYYTLNVRYNVLE